MKYRILSTVLCFVFLTALGGCEQRDNAADTELRIEIEQLQNELGRLEFRVYQLEHPEETSTAEIVDETIDLQVDELSGD